MTRSAVACNTNTRLTIAAAADGFAAPLRLCAGRPELGTLAPGAAADVIVLDDRLEIVRVLVDGADALH